MTIKTPACAMAVALLAGTAFFAVPAAAGQGAPTPLKHAKMSSIHSQKLFLNAVTVYDAGFRRGSANSTSSAYLRGFRDGTSSEAYSSRAYVVNSSAGNQIPAVPRYTSYAGDTVYAPGTGGYSSYDGRSLSYGDSGGFIDDRYGGGSAPTAGLMNVASAPMAAAQYAAARAAQLNYCSARYQSFDPASGTFLANDGYRYYCQ